MKTSSAKGKGRRLQNAIAFTIREQYPVLDGEDVRAAIMGERGMDIHLSPHARQLFGNYAIECKNTENLSIWAAYQQATANAGTLIPLVAFTRNGRPFHPHPIYCALQQKDLPLPFTDTQFWGGKTLSHGVLGNIWTIIEKETARPVKVSAIETVRKERPGEISSLWIIRWGLFMDCLKLSQYRQENVKQKKGE